MTLSKNIAVLISFVLCQGVAYMFGKFLFPELYSFQPQMSFFEHLDQLMRLLFIPLMLWLFSVTPIAYLLKE